MSNSCVRRIAIVFVSLAVLIGGARAQDRRTNELFGKGAHAYFSGEYQATLRYLNSAIADGSRDPRCFYYRGVALYELGRSDKALADFRKGAELEFLAEGTYGVSRSLERIQGASRIALEEIRWDVSRRLKASRQQKRFLLFSTGDTNGEPSSRSDQASLKAEVDTPAVDSGTIAEDPNDPFADAEFGPFGVTNVVVAVDETPAEGAPAGDTVDNAQFDPFGENENSESDDSRLDFDDSFEAADDAQTASGSATGTGGGGLLQSVFRTFTKTFTEGEQPPNQAPGADTGQEENPFGDFDSADGDDEPAESLDAFGQGDSAAPSGRGGGGSFFEMIKQAIPSPFGGAGKESVTGESATRGSTTVQPAPTDPFGEAFSFDQADGPEVAEPTENSGGPEPEAEDDIFDFDFGDDDTPPSDEETNPFLDDPAGS